MKAFLTMKKKRNRLIIGTITAPPPKTLAIMIKTRMSVKRTKMTILKMM